MRFNRIIVKRSTNSQQTIPNQSLLGLAAVFKRQKWQKKTWQRSWKRSLLKRRSAPRWRHRCLRQALLKPTSPWRSKHQNHHSLCLSAHQFSRSRPSPPPMTMIGPRQTSCSTSLSSVNMKNSSPAQWVLNAKLKSTGSSTQAKTFTNHALICRRKSHNSKQ